METQKPYLTKTELLNHGFLELRSVLGSDESIVTTARTAYDKGTKQVSNSAGLIRYLMRRRHTSPFEFAVAIFRVRCPLFVSRQWIRHRTGAYNEISLRYSESSLMFYQPETDMVTTQDRVKKQSRTDEVVEGAELIVDAMAKETKMISQNYKTYLDSGVAREVARINLPLSSYTTFMFKMDLHNLLHFLDLRTDTHAQYEIRVYADTMVKMLEPYFPATIQAWKDYRRDAVTLSKMDILALGDVLPSFAEVLVSLMKTSESDLKEKYGLSAGEVDELFTKIKKFDSICKKNNCK